MNLRVFYCIGIGLGYKGLVAFLLVFEGSI